MRGFRVPLAIMAQVPNPNPTIHHHRTGLDNSRPWCLDRKGWPLAPGPHPFLDRPRQTRTERHTKYFAEPVTRALSTSPAVGSQGPLEHPASRQSSSPGLLAGLWQGRPRAHHNPSRGDLDAHLFQLPYRLSAVHRTLYKNLGTNAKYFFHDGEERWEPRWAHIVPHQYTT